MISSHLFKRNSIYYFRLRVPLDIQPYFSRKEVWKSLKTKDFKTAKTTILKLLYSTERLFLHLRSGMFTTDQIKTLILLRLGFHNYVEGVRRQNKKRLWSNLKKKRDGYSQDFGKWYQRFNRRCVTNDPKKVFHSFRHTLANNLKQNGVVRQRSQKS